MHLTNIVIPTLHDSPAAAERWDITVQDGSISHMQPSESTHDATSRLLLPPLCHPHVHLDKPYILTCNCPKSPSRPDYTDLAPESGSFTEALANTSTAKERYTEPDLYLRGSQLLATSYQQGVTSLRAFVELDHVTGTLPLTTAIRLKADFSHLLHVQICAFAQDPLFSTQHADANRSVLVFALEDYASSIDALGTTPYVERSREGALRNIDWAITTAIEKGLHLDFHLDYNTTDPSASRPLTHSVIEKLKARRWRESADPSRTIALGHCTQLSLLRDTDWQELAREIISSQLPIHFVGLPTSDLFMMGRPGETPGLGSSTHSRPRATLQVPSLIQDLGLSACVGVNNVGNAFTPYGTGDPLELASWGVGIYQSGTVDQARILYGCVSWRARAAIGLGPPGEEPRTLIGGLVRGMLLIENPSVMDLPGTRESSRLSVPARRRTGWKDIVWDPPGCNLRSII
ncbi:amidohydrolase [Xylariomycetidae sp. FL2044]|nr:amidohydrolase [Xylariomycetidae sp. FL2044]